MHPIRWQLHGYFWHAAVPTATQTGGTVSTLVLPELSQWLKVRVLQLIFNFLLQIDFREPNHSVQDLVRQQMQLYAMRGSSS